MSKRLAYAIAVALCACSWPALGPANGAHALGRPCAGSDIHVAIVVDFGDVMSTTSTCIAANSRNRGTDILAARAQALGKPAPRFAGSGLLCAIDGYPETGCGEKNGSTYAYWSYWHGNNGAWTYASGGPASWPVQADYVEGWRWQPNGAEGSVPAPRADANPAATCVPAPPVTETPPAPTTVAAAAPTTAAPAAVNGGRGTPTTRAPTRTPTTVAAGATTVAPPAAGESTVPPVDGSTSTPTSDGDAGATQEIAAREAAPDQDDDDGGGSAPVGLIAGVVLIAAIGGGAFFVQRRRAAHMSRRTLHPLAWWIWALSLAAAALRTTNPLLLGLLIAVAWLVVVARRPEAPWARSFTAFLWLGVFVVAIRVVMQILFGIRLPGEVLFTLPSVDLPSWAAGVTLGGPVTTESLVYAFSEGLQLATLLACVGAANSLASPYRLLRAVPSVLYELGVVVTVALSFAPQATVNAQRVRDARRLRGRPSRGLAGARGLAMPVLEGALDRSLDLAASMDSRGYGRRGNVPKVSRRLAAAATLGGVFAITVGMFGILEEAAPRVLGVPMLVLGAALCAASFAVAKSGAYRSRYRPDHWHWPELLTAAAGVATLVTFIAGGHIDALAMRPAYSPLVAPTLPLLPTLGVLVAALPAVCTPPVPLALDPA